MTKSRHKVLHIAPHFAKYVCVLREGFGPHDSTYYILTRDNFHSELGKSETAPPNVTLFDQASLRRPLLFIRRLFQLRSFVTSANPDLVHAQETRSALFNVLLGFFIGKPIVLTVHDVTPHPGRDSQQSWRERWLQLMVRRKAAATIVHGQALANSYLSLEGFKEKRVFTIPHPAFPPTKSRNRSSQQVPVVLMFGRLEAYKGLETLITACSLLWARGFAFRVHIAGRGPELDRMRSQIAGNPNVTVEEGFLTPDRVEEVFANCDIVVAPYLEGSQSGVLAYALGFAKPIAATCVGALPEVARQNVNALLCEPADAEGLATSMARLIEAPELRAKYGEESQLLSKSEFSSQTVAAKTLAVYQFVLGERSG